MRFLRWLFVGSEGWTKSVIKLAVTYECAVPDEYHLAGSLGPAVRVQTAAVTFTIRESDAWPHLPLEQLAKQLASDLATDGFWNMPEGEPPRFTPAGRIVGVAIHSMTCMPYDRPISWRETLGLA